MLPIKGKNEVGLLEDIVVGWQEHALQFHLENLGIQDKEHYDQNAVVRISTKSDQESQIPRMDNTQINREAYFYGRQ